MWIVFGWEKEEKPLGEIGAAYCFDCRRSTQWFVWKESEWVTLSAIRVFRFILKHHLQCCGCSADLRLSPSEFKQIDRYMLQHDSINGSEIHAALARRIETEQLAGKTPLQLKYIRESRQAQQDYQDALSAQKEPDA